MREIGGSLTLGYYERRRLPTVTRKLEIPPQGGGMFVLGRSKQTMITQQQRQLVRQTAGLGEGTHVTSFRRAFLNQETVMGTTYKRSKARINSVVVCRGDGGDPLFLQVHSFHMVQVAGGEAVTLIALGRAVQKVGNVLAVPPAGGQVHPQHLAHLNEAFFQVERIM